MITTVLAGPACGGRSTRTDGSRLNGDEPPSSAGATDGAGGGAGGSHAGSGGSAGSGVPRTCGFLIDDMEDGSGRICTGEGRLGVWYAYNDGFGVQWPPPQTPGTPILPVLIPDGRNGSTRAMYSSHRYPDIAAVDPAKSWGAGIGLDLHFDGVSYRLYDARGYDGITFFARSSTMYQEFQARINTADTTLVEYGGTCPEEFCNTYATTFGASPEWKQYSVVFSTLNPYLGDGKHPQRPRRDQLTNIQFLFVRYPPNSADADLWIDDVSFFRGPPPTQ